MTLTETVPGLDVLLAFFSTVLGLMVGSFLNVCVARMPSNQSVVRPRSRCPKCENPIAWYDNLPIVSWLLLGAKCRHCKEPISWQYPFVEALTGALFFVVYWRFGFVLATPIYMALTAGLILCTFIDFADWTIPDEVTLPGIPIGILCAVVATWYPASGLRVMGTLEPVYDAIIGVELGGGFLFLLDKFSRLVFKKRGMGGGDVKLLGMLGAFFGWAGALLIIMAASLVGSIIGVAQLLILRSSQEEPDEPGQQEKISFGGWYGCPGTIILTAVVGTLEMLLKKKERPDVSEEDIEEEEESEITIAKRYLPFGPYLCLGGIVVMLFGKELVNTYFDLLNIAFRF